MKKSELSLMAFVVKIVNQPSKLKCQKQNANEHAIEKFTKKFPQ